MKFPVVAALASAALVYTATAAIAGDKPPDGAKKLSEIVIALETAGYNPISEIEFDDGHWEVDAYRDGKKIEVNVDPMTATITPDK